MDMKGGQNKKEPQTLFKSLIPWLFYHPYLRSGK